jgi:hypothetical protein
MSRDQKAELNHSMKIDNNGSFESVEEFKYLGTTLTNQSSLLTYLLNYLLTYLPTHSLTYSLTHLLTHSLTYLLTPHSTVLLQKLTGLQLVSKFSAFYGTRKFITTFTSTSHLSLS